MEVHGYDGYGRYFFNAGGKKLLYEGTFHNSLQDGYGVLRNTARTIFTGLWSNGKKVFGTYEYNDGSTYTGYWRANAKTGYGTYKSSNGRY